MIVLCYGVRFFMSILILIILMEKRASCFALLVFLVSCDCCVVLPRGATGLSAVCSCGIF